MILLLKLFLIVKDVDDVSIMITVLICGLTIVEVDQHVRQILV